MDFIDKTGSIDTRGLKEKFRIFKNSKEEYYNFALDEKNIHEKIEILSSKIKKIKFLNPKKMNIRNFLIKEILIKIQKKLLI